MLELVLISIIVIYCGLVILGFTCFKHEWMEHGPTKHMERDKKTGQPFFWTSYWWVCHRCGKKVPGRKCK